MTRLSTGIVAAVAASASVIVIVAAWGTLSAWGFGTSSATAAPRGVTIAFRESGLPFGTAWSVSLGGATEVAAAPSLLTFAPSSGRYPFSVVPLAGYLPSPTSGYVVVDGTSLIIGVEFASSGRPIQHVVVIVLEDEELGTILSGSSYLGYLAGTYATVSQFYAICHGSLPDYAGMTSGRYFACGSQAIPESPVADLPDLLEQSGLSWAGYFEGMETPCQTYSAGGYVTDHNPFLLYQDIVGNPDRCNADVVNSAGFNESLASGSLPNVSFYVPNTADDCRASSLAACSSWLQGFLAPILNSSSGPVRGVLAHTAFFVVFDEGTTDSGYEATGVVNPWCQNETGRPLSACGGHTDLTVISPYSIGIAFPGPATDYSVASTIEWLFGLPSDGGYDGSAAFPPMTGIFAFAPLGANVAV